MPSLLELVRLKLEAALAPTFLEIEDESALHAGHAGGRGGAGHLRVVVASGKFEGLSHLDRHRLVYEILKEEMRGKIHALALQALGPDEVRP